MNVIKKIDDIGRITIPQDLRRSLRWMGGDEIEITVNPDESLLLRKRQDTNDARVLKEISSKHPELEQQFLDLIQMLEN